MGKIYDINDLKQEKEKEKNSHRDFIEKYKYYVEPEDREPNKRYTSSRNTMRNAKHKQTKSMPLKAKVAAIAVAAVIAVGGIGAVYAHSNSQQQEKVQTVEQALQKGETLESLGISQNTADELQKMEANLFMAEELSDVDLVKLGQAVTNFSLSSSKEKIIKELGLPADTKIEYIHQERTDTQESYIKIGDKRYQTNFGNNKISQNALDYVQKIAKSQYLIGQNSMTDENGNIEIKNKEDLIKSLDNLLKGTEEFLSYDIQQDKDGNIQCLDIMEAQKKAEQEKQEQARIAEEEKKKQEEKANQPKVPITIVNENSKDDGEER